MKYELVIGIDVSKKKLDISEFDGETHNLDQIKNSPSSIRKFLRRYKDNKEEVLFVAEATGIYHIKLADIVFESGFDIAIVNPLQTKKFGDMKMLRANTDITASRKIAEYGYEQEPDLYEKTATFRRKLIKIIKSIDKLIKTKNSYLNRLESINNDSIGYESIEDNYKDLIAQIEAAIEELEAEADRIVKENYPKAKKKLLKIKGVGDVISTAVIGYFGRFETFDNAKQPVAFVGINPHPRQSGTSVKGRGNISKRGSKYLRTKLFMASLSAARFNPACRDLRERLRKKGKHNNVIRIAVANKLLRQIFAVLKYDREWDPNYGRS